MSSSFLKNYKALGIGGIISIVFTVLLSDVGVFIVSPTKVNGIAYLLIHFVAIVLCWLTISYLLNKFPIYKILMVLSLLLGVIVVESLTKVNINPITIPLLVLFWLGVAYLILPDFFMKYRIAIFAIYGLVLSYFLIFRMMPNYLEDYHENFLQFLLLPLPFFAALWVYEQWRWLRILKEDKAKAELTLLKNQIDPHFFFNTLNNLYGLAVEKSDHAPAMILKLSDIMRYTIYEGQADFVALKDELTYLEDYIELHKIRYQKKVEISFEQDIQHPHRIAPLLLIIPLENAFKHGVERLTEAAFIHLDISTTPTSIHYQISNNYEAIEAKEGGIGLKNLKKRLELIYPNQHQLVITQTADTYTVSIEIKPHELSNR